jgi:hypothetical protein
VKKALSIILALVLLVTLTTPVFAAETASATATSATTKREPTIKTGRGIPKDWKVGDDVKITDVYTSGRVRSYVLPNVVDIRPVKLGDKINIIGENDYYDLAKYNNLETMMYTIYTDAKIDVSGFWDGGGYRLRYTKAKGFHFPSGRLNCFHAGLMGADEGWNGKTYYGERTFGEGAYFNFFDKEFYCVFDLEAYPSEAPVSGETPLQAWKGALPIVLRVIKRPETAAK